MSDETVSAALRSSAQLVVVEAPAGCGKTHQAAEYAHWLASTGTRQSLILTHTHAACDVFRARTAADRRTVVVSTIDALVAQVACAYHRALDLPPDASAWARSTPKGFEALAERVCALLDASSAVTRCLVARYPVIACDEHQDANAAQDRLVRLLLAAGARVRVFADPMQSIYVRAKERQAHDARWMSLRTAAERCEQLDTPHRWRAGSIGLGEWILRAREQLTNGQAVDMSGRLPAGLRITDANNTSPRRAGFQLEGESARTVRQMVDSAEKLMILTTQNDTVQAIRAWMGRRLPIWEGHTREALGNLVEACDREAGKTVELAHATKSFIQAVVTGFGDSAFANRFVAEVQSGAVGTARGKMAEVQKMAKCIVDSPNHVGVGRALAHLDHLVEHNADFKSINVDLAREFREATCMTKHGSASTALADITRRRSMTPLRMPNRVVSTVHKAKGLEADNVLVMPCDAEHFPDRIDKRCALYVAMSRSSARLTLAVSRSSSTPLLKGL